MWVKRGRRGSCLLYTDRNFSKMCCELQHSEAAEFDQPPCLPLSVLCDSQSRVISNSSPLPRNSLHWFIQKGFCTKDSLWCGGYVPGLLLGESCSKRSWKFVFGSVIIVKAWTGAFLAACVSQHFSNDHWLLPRLNRFPRLTRKKKKKKKLHPFSFYNYLLFLQSCSFIRIFCSCLDVPSVAIKRKQLYTVTNLRSHAANPCSLEQSHQSEWGCFTSGLLALWSLGGSDLKLCVLKCQQNVLWLTINSIIANVMNIQKKNPNVFI